MHLAKTWPGFLTSGGPQPDLERTPPLLAYKEYIDKCGGDGEQTILHCVPPPRTRQCRMVRRSIKSPSYATAQGVYLRLLCCWQDPPESTCQGYGCPCLPINTLLEADPNSPPTDFHKLVPCTFAGMPGGCVWHKERLVNTQWFVPLFKVCNEHQKDNGGKEEPSP